MRSWLLLGCGLFLGWDEREDAAEDFVVPGFEVVAHAPDALFGLLAELVGGLVRQIGREWNVVPQGRDGGVELAEFFKVPGFEVGFQSRSTETRSIHTRLSSSSS